MLIGSRSARPRTIINIIEALVRIIWIIHDERATQTITVLQALVAMVPECPLYLPVNS